MADMQQVMALLNTRHRVVLVPKRTGKESDMSKSKKAVEKKASAKKVPAVKGGKAPKVTMTKPEAVNAAMQAVDQDKKKRSSGLDAAAQVLREAGKPMSCKEMVEVMLAKGLWKTSGKTPDATIYSAVIREIATKGTAARFKKVDRGQFEFAGKEA
jgi:hypothetical protein